MQHAITFVIAALCILAIAYRLYGVFFVRNVLRADDKLVTRPSGLPANEPDPRTIALSMVGRKDRDLKVGESIVVRVVPPKWAPPGMTL